MICRPTGSPSSVTPAGTLAAGCPVRLKGKVNGIQPSTETACPAISRGPERPTGNGATAVVGVSNRSKRARNVWASCQ